MDVSSKIKHFSKLGEIMGKISTTEEWPGFSIGISESEWKSLKEAITFAKIKNGWFEERFVLKALQDWSALLQEEKLQDWVAGYNEVSIPRKIAVIAAGNIPMVGFHDMLSVVLSGHELHVKLSSDDDVIIPELVKLLKNFDQKFDALIHLYDSTDKVKGFDAVIATGNNNSARYFEYYFGKYPHIIRKNRTSLAVLDGSESDEEIKLLGEDMFTYFGLGCRNISHIMVPEEYDLNTIFGNIVDFGDIIQNKKYGNNYDYHKAIFLMNRDDLLENGFVMFRESKELFAPLSVIHYQRYNNHEEVNRFLNTEQDNIQVIVGKKDDYENFGEAQQPQLNDYADGIDTMAFLRDL